MAQIYIVDLFQVGLKRKTKLFKIPKNINCDVISNSFFKLYLSLTIDIRKSFKCVSCYSFIFNVAREAKKLVDEFFL